MMNIEIPDAFPTREQVFPRGEDTEQKSRCRHGSPGVARLAGEDLLGRLRRMLGY